MYYLKLLYFYIMHPTYIGNSAGVVKALGTMQYAWFGNKAYKKAHILCVHTPNSYHPAHPAFNSPAGGGDGGPLCY